MAGPHEKNLQKAVQDAQIFMQRFNPSVGGAAPRLTVVRDTNNSFSALFPSIIANVDRKLPEEKKSEGQLQFLKQNFRFWKSRFRRIFWWRMAKNFSANQVSNRPADGNRRTSSPYVMKRPSSSTAFSQILYGKTTVQRHYYYLLFLFFLQYESSFKPTNLNVWQTGVGALREDEMCENVKTVFFAIFSLLLWLSPRCL